MRKTLRSLLLVIVLGVILIFVGCANNNSQNNNIDNSDNNNGNVQNDENSNETLNYDLTTVRWTDAWPIDFLENGIMKSLEEKHNINIDWQVFYYGDWAEQKSLLLASEDLPDAFFASICLSDSDIAQNKENLMELTDLINDNMPNLVEVFEKDPELYAQAVNREGEIYSLVKRLPLRPKCQDVMFINRTWLDNLDLDMPDTYLDLQQTLKSFVEQDADGDGDPSNEIGYSNTANLAVDLRHLLSPFGTLVSRSGNYMGLDKDGNPIFMPVQDNFKEAVKWANELYQDGLLDPERFTQDLSMVTAKTKDPEGANVGIVYGWTADAQVGVNSDDFEIVKALKGPDGERYQEHDPTYLDMSDKELIITNECENPERLLKWADDFYTSEVSLQTYYGSIPDYIEKNDDGTYEVLLPPDDGSLDTSAWSNSFRDFGPKWMAPKDQELVILPESQGDGVKLALDAVNEEYIKDITFPMVKYTQDQLAEMVTLTTDIYEYVESQYANWVVDGGIEEQWDKYIETLNNMGFERLMEIHNDAYDAYKEKIN